MSARYLKGPAARRSLWSNQVTILVLAAAAHGVLPCESLEDVLAVVQSSTRTEPALPTSRIISWLTNAVDARAARKVLYKLESKNKGAPWLAPLRVNPSYWGILEAATQLRSHDMMDSKKLQKTFEKWERKYWSHLRTLKKRSPEVKKFSELATKCRQRYEAKYGSLGNHEIRIFDFLESKQKLKHCRKADDIARAFLERDPDASSHVPRPRAHHFVQSITDYVGPVNLLRLIYMQAALEAASKAELYILWKQLLQATYPQLFEASAGDSTRVADKPSTIKVSSGCVIPRTRYQGPRVKTVDVEVKSTHADSKEALKRSVNSSSADCTASTSAKSGKSAWKVNFRDPRANDLLKVLQELWIPIADQAETLPIFHLTSGSFYELALVSAMAQDPIPLRTSSSVVSLDQNSCSAVNQTLLKLFQERATRMMEIVRGAIDENGFQCLVTRCQHLCPPKSAASRALKYLQVRNAFPILDYEEVCSTLKCFWSHRGLHRMMAIMCRPSRDCTNLVWGASDQILRLLLLGLVVHNLSSKELIADYNEFLHNCFPSLVRSFEPTESEA
eukprot:Blabericola_migrator_1__1797@NODE_1487_length_4436_cov_58_863127_g976_i0_p2_GENE_NODE_1487_length_4436_cov_58_863127_g976_i0NODE_1487_length_4436_cov_58_863127_g976_i0_p2_ORF_typecomplete_len561_score51_68_NODE_1487_length_4436_cov_58_863127_g976_i01791861